MNKKQQHISYEIAKISFGIYLVNELRELCGKEFPTETDVKKLLWKIDPSYTAGDLQPAKQISRYCQTTKDYLRDAREETLDKVAKLLHVPISSFHAFREKINPALKSFKYYHSYIEQAEAYHRAIQGNNMGPGKQQFCELFACNDQSKIFLSMITYNFGEENLNLPAVSFSAETDRFTERKLRDLFEQFDLPSPQYLPENNFSEKTLDQNEGSIFIAIGLFGNPLTEWMSKTGKLISTLEIVPEKKCIRLQGKTYTVSRDEGIDHALFSKTTLPNNNTVFIVGGIEGTGTHRLGEYFFFHWLTIQEKTSGHKNVALLFQTTAGATKLLSEKYND